MNLSFEAWAPAVWGALLASVPALAHSYLAMATA